ncbi:MutT/nudix family protein [Apiospora rasikravindrae]|uniref:MutT/nudix family protein n=1 Tax=Apiospora rasikravindrae TaxID=990691 RepID=A0ABR1RMX3_9PEZI
MSTNAAKVVSTQPLDTNDARWIKLLKIDYKDARGKPRTWETAERRTRPQGGDIDGVGIVAILEKPTGQLGKTSCSLLTPLPQGNTGSLTDVREVPIAGPEIVLQKQFRPPIDKICIEVPAGLVDEGETAEQAAIRELREETGYVAEVSETTPMMFNDPGFCNTNLRMVHVTIDMSLPENQDPKPQLEDDEFIEVFTAPLKDLWAECKRLEAEGYAIDARVGTLAEGIEIAKQFKL